MGSKSLVLALMLYLIPPVALGLPDVPSGADQPQKPQQADANATPNEDEESFEWLDSSHSYVVEHADNIAEWMNNFFGDVRTEEEAPYSTLRLRLEQEWDENDQFDSDIKLRGKVYLPNFNNKLSLLFSDEDTGETGRDDLLIDERDTPEDVSLQYRVSEKERSSLDFRVGVRSSINLKTSARYRYTYPLSEKLIGMASQEILYLGGDGFASKTRLEFDRILNEDKLIQWHNKVEWQENISGITWNTSLSLDKRLSDKKAFSYFVGMDGETEPENQVNNYVVGIRYRQNMLRPWLYGEIQPSYRWSKEFPGAERDGAVVILFRLEAVFHKDFSEY
ncbi:MAG: hypothetical protein M0Q95_04575 [Porticoccaceae bacterium]|nr:hypothetical protein [Porticoccaceae bacterium]